MVVVVVVVVGVGVGVGVVVLAIVVDGGCRVVAAVGCAVVCAVVVCVIRFDTEELIEFAKERLSGPKVPKKVFFRPDLPKTGSGKVLKRNLKQWVQENL